VPVLSDFDEPFAGLFPQATTPEDCLFPSHDPTPLKMIDYNDRVFRSVSNSANGETSQETIFYYKQTGLQVTAMYSGGRITDGSLTAVADEAGNLTMRYQHMNTEGKFLTGVCLSTPEMLPNGKMRLYEKWQWTCGDYSKGESIVEEI
jgi:hypothetical protein